MKFKQQPQLNESNRIPDFARAWEEASEVRFASVRRPFPLPDPKLYHEVVEPSAIFELDETQRDGSIETILVVPFGCERCKTQKQACSRSQPACVRCIKAGLTCTVAQEGYQRLPRPKSAKPSLKQNAKSSDASSPTHEPTAGQTLHIKRIASASKRPLSPEPDPIPLRKKTRAEAKSRKGETRCNTVAPQEDMDKECSRISGVGSSAQMGPTVESTGERSTLKWVFVKNARILDDCSGNPGQEPMHSDTLIPRVWTSSLEGLLTVFPQLAKTTVGFSWLQSETPVLLLDSNYARGRWINSTTLTIDLIWDFTCHESELEPVVELEAGSSAQPHSMVHSPENTPDREDEMMDSQRSFLPRSESFPTLDAQIPSDGPPQRELYTHESRSRESSPSLQYPSHSPEKSGPSHPYPASNGSLAYHTIPQIKRIPYNKPLEVETLLGSQLQFIPLLLWISADSKLMPCNLPPEYVYLSMGLFFISDLCHAVIQQDVPSDTGVVQGRVCWSVTLQWASGGEDALFDGQSTSSPDMILDSAPLCATKNLSHPWWFHTADILSRADDTIRPRDLRTHSISYIPLHFLGEFQPSEIFPRGWFCKSCGMINIQEFFRHQICQSTKCRSTQRMWIPQGKVDSLSSLRDPYQSSTLIRPTNHVPSTVVTDHGIWDDGIQTWVYGIKDGVTLCHIFTGNQETLQEDATALLESTQREVPLRKEDGNSPYFVHTTRFVHPKDGSETKVSCGTPGCVRTAYYALCDFARRYAEIDALRFGEVRIQAWVNAGQKRGSVLSASRSPVVVHCLGAKVVLNLTPKGGYTDGAGSTALNKGKGRAQGEIPSTELCSRELEQERGDRVLLISEREANELLTDVDDSAAATDMMRAVTMSDLNASYSGPGMEVPQEVAKPKRGRPTKNKVVKDKGKASVPELTVTLVHGDAIVLCGDDFECQIVRFGTTILVIGFPEVT